HHTIATLFPYTTLFRSVNSEIMDTNILKANWIQGGQALFDKVFINNAMVERLTSKTVFARDMQSITIDAVQANITTVMNSMGQRSEEHTSELQSRFDLV